MCGAITVLSNGSLDVDFFKFTLGPTATMMNLQFHGTVSVKVVVNAVTVVLTPVAPNQALPFVKNHEYSVEVQSFDGRPQDYTLRLNEN
jgi:hypothetical protein